MRSMGVFLTVIILTTASIVYIRDTSLLITGLATLFIIIRKFA